MGLSLSTVCAADALFFESVTEQAVSAAAEQSTVHDFGQHMALADVAVRTQQRGLQDLNLVERDMVTWLTETIKSKQLRIVDLADTNDTHIFIGYDDDLGAGLHFSLLRK